MFCLAVQIEDTQLAELAAKSCLHLNFMDHTDWTVSALTKFDDLDKDVSQKLVSLIPIQIGHKLKMILDFISSSSRVSGKKGSLSSSLSQWNHL